MMKTLKEAYRDYFKIGAAISHWSYRSVADLIVSQFDSVTCENEMKLGSLRGEDFAYHFERADEMYRFAMDHGIEMRGHNLIWHQQSRADQLKEMSSEQLLRFVEDHMLIVGKRYSGLSCWDVVNEAVSDRPDEFMRDSVWKEKFGEDFVLRFFTLARNLLPGARLVYNDYNEFIPSKRKNILKLVSMLKAEGVIDAIGLQGHIRPKVCSIDDLKRTMDEYAALGLPLQVTELDIGLPDMDDPTPVEQVTTEEREKHTKFYRDYFALLRDYHEALESVTLWGVADDMSWLNYFRQRRNCSALLFGRDHQPNDAYGAIIDF